MPQMAAPTNSPTFGGPLTGCGPVAVLKAPADALAGLAVEAISAWRAGGVDPGDIAVLARVNSALLPVQVACMEAGVPCTTPLSASVLERTGIRTALAYLRIGADPDSIRREDVQETIRRPSRGIASNVVDMLTSSVNDFDHRHTTTCRPPLGPRRPKARGLRDRPRDRSQGLWSLVCRGARSHSCRHRAWRHHGRPRWLAQRGRPLHPCR